MRELAIAFGVGEATIWRALHGEPAESRLTLATTFACATIHLFTADEYLILCDWFGAGDVEGVRRDLVRLLDGIKADHPAFNYELAVPAKGTEEGWCQDPMVCPPQHPLVEALAEGQSFASGQAASVGGWGRLGNVGDGNIIAALGIPTVQYGPGDIRIYKEWPTPDERVMLEDLITAAKAISYATIQLCGHK